MVMCVVMGEPPRIPASIVYITSVVNGAAVSVQTFASIAIGAVNSAAATARGVSSNRQIFVATAAGSIVTGVTVSGIAASLVVSSTYTKLYRASVPSGTTVSVVVTQNTASAQSISVWTAYDILSVTPIDTSTAGSTINGSVTHSIPLNTSASGIVVGYAIIAASDAIPTLTWSGLPEDGFLYLTTDIYSAASVETATASLPRAVSAAMTGGIGSVTAAIAASFS